MAAAAARAADPYINRKPTGCRVRVTTGGDSQECASSGGDIVRFGNSGALALSSDHKDSKLAEMEARSLAPLAGDTIALALKKTNGVRGERGKRGALKASPPLMHAPPAPRPRFRGSGPSTRCTLT